MLTQGIQLFSYVLSNQGGSAQWKRDQAGFDAERRSKAQFAERFTVIRGKIQFAPREVVKLNDVTYKTFLPCDDAESQSDNFVSIFDGVGSLGVWSGKFARHLAMFSKERAAVDQLPSNLLAPNANRSKNILEKAHQTASDTLTDRNDPQESSGNSTAVVLSLVSLPGDEAAMDGGEGRKKHTVHEYVYGDSRSSAPLGSFSSPFAQRARTALAALFPPAPPTSLLNFRRGARRNRMQLRLTSSCSPAGPASCR